MSISHIKLACANLQTEGITVTISAFHRQALYPALCATSRLSCIYQPTILCTYTRHAHSRAGRQRKNTGQRERLTYIRRCEAVLHNPCLVQQFVHSQHVYVRTSPQTTGTTYAHLWCTSHSYVRTYTRKEGLT